MAGGSSPLGHQGADESGVEPGRVRGSEILGDQHRRPVGGRHTGLGLSEQPSHQAPFDVTQVGGSLSHQSAHLGEGLGELLHRPVQGGEQVLVGPQVLAHRPAQTAVGRQARTGGHHLCGVPRRPCGLVLKPRRHLGCRGVVGGKGRLDVGEAPGAVGSERGG